MHFLKNVVCCFSPITTFLPFHPSKTVIAINVHMCLSSRVVLMCLEGIIVLAVVRDWDPEFILSLLELKKGQIQSSLAVQAHIPFTPYCLRAVLIY